MSTMQSFHDTLFGAECAPELQPLAALAALEPAQFAAFASDLGWEMWQSEAA